MVVLKNCKMYLKVSNYTFRDERGSNNNFGEGRSVKLDDRRSALKNLATEGRPQQLDGRRPSSKNWTTEGRPLKIGRPKVGPKKLDDRRSTQKIEVEMKLEMKLEI